MNPIDLDGPAKQRITLLQLHIRIGKTQSLLGTDDWREIDAYLMAANEILARHDRHHLTTPITDDDDPRFDAAVTGLQDWRERL